MTEVTQIEYTQEEQNAALTHFFNLASVHCHGGARVAAGILLGLYNGTRFPFDLTDLRLLDQNHYGMAMALLDMDRRPVMEVHEWLDLLYDRTDFGARFEHLAHKWKLKGRGKKEWLQPVEPIGELQIGGAA